jgi:hypothetical protein
MFEILCYLFLLFVILLFSSEFGLFIANLTCLEGMQIVQTSSEVLDFLLLGRYSDSGLPPSLGCLFLVSKGSDSILFALTLGGGFMESQLSWWYLPNCCNFKGLKHQFYFFQH